MFRTVARVLSIIGMLGFVYLLTLSNGAFRAMMNANSVGIAVTSAVGGITALGIFLPWLMAVYDWGTRFQGSLERRRRWGQALIFAAFVGGWLYWLRGSATQAPLKP